MACSGSATQTQACSVGLNDLVCYHKSHECHDRHAEQLDKLDIVDNMLSNVRDWRKFKFTRVLGIMRSKLRWAFHTNRGMHWWCENQLIKKQ